MKHLIACLVLCVAGCAGESDDSSEIVDVNGTGEVATEGGGNPFDEQNPNRIGPDLSKQDGNAYRVPTHLPPLENPRIVVSLEGLTVELIDEATGFHKAYPTGVGARGSNGVSFTPVGEFNISDDPSNGWWFYPRRYEPSYFGGFPFLRLTARNSRGYQTYGLHGPITATLIRGFVSHGCMRMRGDDIVELFYIMKNHPGASVSIQTEKRYDELGNVIDVTPPELDPVAAYRATLCDSDVVANDTVLAAGEHTELSVCGQADRYQVLSKAGSPVRVSASANAPLRITLTAGSRTTTVEADGSDESYAAVAEITPASDGAVEVKVEGTVVDYALTVEAAEVDASTLHAGWVGGACETADACGDADCLAEAPAGLCTLDCTRACPDLPGHAVTFCVDLGDGAGHCVSQCDADADCREGYHCADSERFGDPDTRRMVCRPAP